MKQFYFNFNFILKIIVSLVDSGGLSLFKLL